MTLSFHASMRPLVFRLQGKITFKIERTETLALQRDVGPADGMLEPAFDLLAP